MPGIVSRKPVVGIAAGILFGSLGLLLMDLKNVYAEESGLFLFAGAFFLFVAMVSFLAGMLGFFKAPSR